MLTNGRATIKPAVAGFLNDNQLAKEIIKLANITLRKKNTMKYSKIIIYYIFLNKIFQIYFLLFLVYKM